MKSYTDLKQSKKLAEILPLESADMWWLYITAQGKRVAMMYEEPDPHYLARMESYGIKDAAIRCWSLAALLDILPNSIYDNTDEYSQLEFSKVSVAYHDMNDGIKIGTLKDNLIDACYEMIIRLNELNLL